MKTKRTDTERLDWLEKQTNGDHWIARQSTTGRGYRLHNSSRENGRPTAREAIDAAMANDPTTELVACKVCGKYGCQCDPAEKVVCQDCGQIFCECNIDPGHD